MRTVGIKVLKNKLSEYVRLASRGETVLISDRDHVVAELVPPRATRGGDVADAMLADLVRRGVLTPAILAPGGRPAVPTPTVRLSALMSELDRDRSDR